MCLVAVPAVLADYGRPGCDAPDVVAGSGRGDVLAVGDDAADRRAVAEVPVGAEDSAGALRHRHAPFELTDRPLVVISEDPDHGIPFTRLPPIRRGGRLMSSFQ